MTRNRILCVNEFELFRLLELPGKSASFRKTYADAERYYDEMVLTELAANLFLFRMTAGPTRLPLCRRCFCRHRCDCYSDRPG